jgi:hypothetical protein
LRNRELKRNKANADRFELQVSRIETSRKRPQPAKKCGWGNSFKSILRLGLTLNDFSGLDAAGADADTLATTVELRLDRLKVDVPATTGSVVRVRDVVSELRAFAAEITFVCHILLQS